ncbi:hypothetical protein [Tatumella terrea]|uniref:hypothetical protein n=1 Tax=Tatumella terrea TaxID=419007 RepID=UPI0031E359DD
MSNKYNDVAKAFQKETVNAEEAEKAEKKRPGKAGRHSKHTHHEDEEECTNPKCSQLISGLEDDISELKKYAEQAESTKDSLYRLESLRKRLAYIIFSIIGFWLVLVFCLVFLGSLDVTYFKGKCSPSSYNLLRSIDIISQQCIYLKHGTVLSLSEKIVITLITTTTVNVLGLAYIVARWLYPEPKVKKKKKKKKGK